MLVSALEVAVRHVVEGTNDVVLAWAHVVDNPHDEKVPIALAGAVELAGDEALETLDERHEDEACWKSPPPSVGRHSTLAVAGADAALLELAVVAYHNVAVADVVVGLNVIEEEEARSHHYYCCCDGGAWMPLIE